MFNDRNPITKELTLELLNEIKQQGSIKADTHEKRIFLEIGRKYFKSDGKEPSQAFHGTIWQHGLSLTEEGKKYLSENNP